MHARLVRFQEVDDELNSAEPVTQTDVTCQVLVHLYIG